MMAASSTSATPRWKAMLQASPVLMVLALLVLVSLLPPLLNLAISEWLRRYVLAS